MDGSTVRGNLKEQIFGIGTSCIHGRFVQGEIWCKILRSSSLPLPRRYYFHDLFTLSAYEHLDLRSHQNLRVTLVTVWLLKSRFSHVFIINCIGISFHSLSVPVCDEM